MSRTRLCREERCVCDLAEMVGSDISTVSKLEWGRWDLHSPHEGFDFRDSSQWAFDLLTAALWQIEAP